MIEELTLRHWALLALVAALWGVGFGLALRRHPPIRLHRPRPKPLRRDPPQESNR